MGIAITSAPKTTAAPSWMAPTDTSHRFDALPSRATAPRSVSADPTLLVNETEALPALEQALSGAKHVINVSMFSWFPTGSGAEVAAILEARAKAGVEVNVMLDDDGSLQLPGTKAWSMVKTMQAAGIHVIRNSSFPLIGKDPVDHRKLYTIDGDQAFLGGMNLSATYDKWHDAMTTFGGNSAVIAGQQFLIHWQQHGGAISAANQGLYQVGTTIAPDAGTAIISNTPHGDEQITQAYLQGISAARSRVWVESPVISSQALASALEGAARRGVDTRLVISGQESTHGIPGLSLISQTFYAELIAAGVKIYTQADMSHSKILLTDNTAAVGSFNLTNRSMQDDNEIDLQTSSAPFVDSVQGMFQLDMSGGKQVQAADLGNVSGRILTGVHKVLHPQY